MPYNADKIRASGFGALYAPGHLTQEMAGLTHVETSFKTAAQNAASRQSDATGSKCRILFKKDQHNDDACIQSSALTLLEVGKNHVNKYVLQSNYRNGKSIESQSSNVIVYNRNQFSRSSENLFTSVAARTGASQPRSSEGPAPSQSGLSYGNDRS